MSILTEPLLQKQDSIKGFNSEIAQSLGINAAVIIQQLHYWNQKGMGIVVENKRYIYNTYQEWIKEQFKWLSTYQFRVWMGKLRALKIVEVIQFRKKEYNRTNYYHLNYDRLYQYLGWSKAENTEATELRKSTNRKVNSPQIEIENSAPSYTKNNDKENNQRITPTQEKEKHNDFYEETSTNYRSTLSQETTKVQESSSQVKTKKSRDVAHPSELRLFHEALVTGLKNLGAVRCPDAVAKVIIKDVQAGVNNSYWSDFKAGLPIGTSTKPEWEGTPGIPYPKFVNYLREKLAEPHDSPEKALIRASQALDNKPLARLLWNDFKRIIEGLSQDSDKNESNGKQSNIPSWFVDRAEISVEQAAESAERLNKRTTNIDWVSKGLPNFQPILSGTAFKPVPLENVSINFGSYSADLEFLISKAKIISKFPSKISLWVADFRAALNNATDKEKTIIKTAIANHCPLMMEILQIEITRG